MAVALLDRNRAPPQWPSMSLLARPSASLRVNTVLRTALDMAAHSFVLAHNHPSGDPTPTRDDEAMTLELRHLAAELHVPFKAHVIVTPSGRYAAVHE
ncbi:JAB domain-containing protein [Sorangium cellulosum]|nr:JAB domain-containing protein [Sorangium cellulosum]